MFEVAYVEDLLPAFNSLFEMRPVHAAVADRNDG